MAKRGSPNPAGENILCPCFRASGEKEIWCESHVPESSGVVIRYRNAGTLKKQIEIYCKQNYQRCEHFLSVKHMKWED